MFLLTLKKKNVILRLSSLVQPVGYSESFCLSLSQSIRNLLQEKKVPVRLDSAALSLKCFSKLNL